MSKRFILGEKEIAKIIMASPYALADSPAQAGLGAKQIKKYFYEFIRIFIQYINNSLECIGSGFDSFEENLSLYYASQSDHESSTTAHEDIRISLQSISNIARNALSVANSAHSAAMGKNKVHPVSSILGMYDCILENYKVGKNNISIGDIFILSQKGVPEFLLLCDGKRAGAEAFELADSELVQITVGGIYYLTDADVSVMALESGFDTSNLADVEWVEGEISRLSYELEGKATSLQDSIASLDGSKQDKLTFDDVPQENSTNPVTSSGVYNAIDNLAQIQNDYLVSALKSFEEYMDAKHILKEEMGDIEAALDSILAIQEELIGGESK